MIRIVFLGTPDYVLPILEGLHKAFIYHGTSPIVAVITQEPRPVGRNKFATFTPVDKWAHKHHIETFYSFDDFLKSNIKADVGILAAFGQILPAHFLTYFTHGVLNIHPSLLPKYRGAACIQASIMNGDKKTGVSIIKMDKNFDTGPILAKVDTSILPDDTAFSLSKKLSVMGLKCQGQG